MAGSTVYTPTFDGDAVFGDPTQFAAAPFGGPPANEDAFLGLPRGTTKYPPACNGAAFAVTGVLTGPDMPTVQALQAALQACAGGNAGAVFARPTGLPQPPLMLYHTGCYFLPGELMFSTGGFGQFGFGAGGFGQGGLQQIAGGWYQLPYRMVIRQVGTGTLY